MDKVTARQIYDFYDKYMIKNIKNRNKVLRFEVNKSQYVKYIVDVLNGDRKFRHKYNIFLIYEPKPRIIMSLNICDKIVNHYFTVNYLQPKLEHRLDIRNVATRKNMGTDYAIKLLKKDLEYYKRRNEDVYVLKLDISKFFYTIDHEVLKKMLYEDIDYDDYLFISKIIDSTNYSYINENIMRILDRYPSLNLPLYEYGKGLPIGNLSSQCLSVYYLNKLDHFIVHDLGLKHYIRYMDDFIILFNDKAYLQKCMKIISDKLINEYKLTVNPKKTYIINFRKQGLTFLGYKFSFYGNKTIMTVKRSSIENMKKRVKRRGNLYRHGKITFSKYFFSVSNYYYASRCNYVKVRNIVDSLMCHF